MTKPQHCFVCWEEWRESNNPPSEVVWTEEQAIEWCRTRVYGEWKKIEIK